MAKFTGLVLLLVLKVIENVRLDDVESEQLGNDINNEIPFIMPTEAQLLDLANAMRTISAPSGEEGVFMEMNSSAGLYEVDEKLGVTVVNEGSHCWTFQDKANIYIPKAKSGKTFPIVSYAHGFTIGGHKLHEAQGTRIHKAIAAEGYVVIAHQSGGTSHYCDSSIDQINMIKWIITSDYAQYIVQPVVSYVMGFSMGGEATLKSASQDAAIRAYNIKGAIAFMPFCGETKNGKDIFRCKIPKIPTFLISGGKDTQAPDKFIYTVYHTMSKVGGAPASKLLFENMPHNPEHNVWVNDLAGNAKKALVCFRTGQCKGIFDERCYSCSTTCDLQWQCLDCRTNPKQSKCLSGTCDFCGTCGLWEGCPNGCTWCNRDHLKP